MKISLLWAHALHINASDEDEVTLLQLSQRTQNPGSLAGSLVAVTSKSSRVDSVTAVESIVQSALKSGTTIDDTTKEVLAEVKQSLTDVSEVAIKDAHDVDVAARQHALENVQTECDGAYQTSFDQDKDIKDATTGKEDEHAACRTAQAEVASDAEEKCEAVDNYLGSLTPPNCQVPSKDGMDSYISSLKSYYASLETQWPTVLQTCTDAQGTEAAKIAECNTKQSAFESAFCSYRHDVYTTCKEYRNCFNTMEYELTQVLDATAKSAASRKLEWTAIQKIKCYVDVLLSDKETSERQEQMDACKDLNPDTSHLDLADVTLPSPKDCTALADVSEYPCTDMFVKNKYEDKGISTIQDCQPCPPLPQDYLSIPGHIAPIPKTVSVESLDQGSIRPSDGWQSNCAVGDAGMPAGPWQLAMNINTRDGNFVPYFNWKFWESPDDLGGATDDKNHAFTKDFKDLDVFNNVKLKRIMIVTHQDGWARAFRAYKATTNGSPLAHIFSFSLTCGVDSLHGGSHGSPGAMIGTSFEYDNRCTDNRDPFAGNMHKGANELYVNQVDGDDANRLTVNPRSTNTNNLGAGLGTAYDWTTAVAASNYGKDGSSGSPCGRTQRPQADAEGWSSNHHWAQGLIGKDHVCYDNYNGIGQPNNAYLNPPYGPCPWTGQSGLDYDFAIYVSDVD